MIWASYTFKLLAYQVGVYIYIYIDLHIASRFWYIYIISKKNIVEKTHGLNEMRERFSKIVTIV